MTIEAELPDGTILEFPDGTADGVIQNVVKQQLGIPAASQAQPTAPPPIAAAGAVPIPEPQVVTPGARGPETSSAFQFGSEALNRFFDNFAGAARTVGPMALARPANFFEAILGAEEGTVPLANQPLPTAEQLRAGASAVTSDPLDARAAFSEARADQERRKEEAPTATATGEIAGDFLTLATGRAPAVRSVAKTQFAKGARKAREAVLSPGLQKMVAPGARRALQEIFKSKSVSSLGRGASRAAEVGLEGAALSIVQGNDPVEIAAFTAGGQAAGSLAIKLGTTKAGLAGLTGAAFATASLLQIIDSAAPGGRDFILENVESAYNKVTAALVVGGLAGLAGAGRLRGRRFEDLPAFVDGITTLPRSIAISLFNDFKRDESGKMGVVARALTEDPEAFSPSERRRLSRVLKTGKGSFLDTISDLEGKSAAFRRKLLEFDPPEGPVTGS